MKTFTNCLSSYFENSNLVQVDELRNKLEQKNKLIEKKTQEALQVNKTNKHGLLHCQFRISENQMTYLYVYALKPCVLYLKNDMRQSCKLEQT